MTFNNLNNRRQRQHWTTNGPADKWIGDISQEAYGLVLHYGKLEPHRREERLASIECLSLSTIVSLIAWFVRPNLYLELNFLGGALRTATRASNILSAHNLQDPIILEWIKHLDEMWRAQQDTFNAEYIYAANNYRITPPVQALVRYTTREPDDSNVRTAWSRLAENIGHEKLAVRYARLLAIDTSVLEQVFQLEGSSVSCLVKLGFFVGAIERVGCSSAIRNQDMIIAVLRNFQKALSACANMWKQHGVIDSNMISSVHECVVAGGRVKDSYHPFGMIPIREWRDRVVYCPGLEAQPPLIYHKHMQVADSIHTLLTMASSLVNQSMMGKIQNPYTLAAWIHHALVCTHPFVDGNGRTTRIIASIPLLLSHLPPINIDPSDRLEYFKALQVADKQFDLRPLSECFASQTIKTLERLSDINAELVNVAVGDTQSGNPVTEYEAGLFTGPISL